MRGQAYDKFLTVKEDQKSVCVSSHHHCVPLPSKIELFVILLQVFWISAFFLFLSRNELFSIVLLIHVYSKFVQFSSTTVFVYISKKKWRA